MQASEIYRQTVAYFLRPIQPLLDDADVSEVLVNGYQTIYLRNAADCIDRN